LIAWAVSGQRCRSIPSFTERVNAKDAGIDAEWDFEIAEGIDTAAGLIGPGWNIFQYKQREALSQDRARTVRSLAKGLQGALRDVARRAGRRPHRYAVGYCAAERAMSLRSGEKVMPS
jgi:hypothetical protein